MSFRLVYERKIPHRNLASSPGKILPRMLIIDLKAFFKLGMSKVKKTSEVKALLKEFAVFLESKTHYVVKL